VDIERGLLLNVSEYTWDNSCQETGDDVERRSLGLHIMKMLELLLDIWTRSRVAGAARHVWGKEVKLMMVIQGVQCTKSHGILDIFAFGDDWRRPEQLAGTYSQLLSMFWFLLHIFILCLCSLSHLSRHCYPPLSPLDFPLSLRTWHASASAAQSRPPKSAAKWKISFPLLLSRTIKPR
jgi:hypothetical protein